jgi:hypothetical protein
MEKVRRIAKGPGPEVHGKMVRVHADGWASRKRPRSAPKMKDTAYTTPCQDQPGWCIDWFKLGILTVIMIVPLSAILCSVIGSGLPAFG